MTKNRKQQHRSESRSVSPVQCAFSTPTGEGSILRNLSNLANIDETEEFERSHLPIEIGSSMIMSTPERVDISEKDNDESRRKCHTDPPIGRRRSNTFHVELNRLDNSKIENNSVRDERPHYGRQRSQSWNENVVRHSSDEPSREWFWIWS
jgi:hypothetical protein